MEFNKTDMIIVVGMVLAIIMMSFTFSAVGLVGEEKADENDIPEFEQSNESYDFAGEFPQDVERTELSSGEVNVSNISTDNFAFKTPKDGEFAGFNESDNFPEPTWRVRLGEWDGTVYYDEQNVSAGESFYLNDTANYEIHGEYGEDGDIIRYRVIQGSTNEYSGIIGGILRIADILYWFVATLITVFTNAFANLFEYIVFIFDLLNWQINTYQSIVEGASSWASIMVLIPAIILMYEFAKIGMLIVDILWIG